jgi:hypothetical protein
MASITPDELPDVTRQNFFSASISISGENVVSVTCIPEFVDPGITIVTSTSSIQIFGQNLAAPFEDQATYVEKGSSDKLEIPKIVIGPIWGPTAKLPPNKDLYIFKQDSKSDTIKNYFITIVEEDTITMEQTTTEIILTQTIRNDWSSGTAALKAYYGT